MLLLLRSQEQSGQAVLSLNAVARALTERRLKMQSCQTFWQSKAWGLHAADTVWQVVHLLWHQKSVCEGSGMEVHTSICSSRQKMKQGRFVMREFEEAGNTLKHERMLKRSYSSAY